MSRESWRGLAWMLIGIGLALTCPYIDIERRGRLIGAAAGVSGWCIWCCVGITYFVDWMQKEQRP